MHIKLENRVNNFMNDTRSSKHHNFKLFLQLIKSLSLSSKHIRPLKCQPINNQGLNSYDICHVWVNYHVMLDPHFLSAD